MRQLSAEQAGCRQAVQFRHREIHEHDVRSMGVRQRDSFPAGARLRDHGDPVCLQEAAQSIAKEGVVVSDEYLHEVCLRQ